MQYTCTECFEVMNSKAAARLHRDLTARHHLTVVENVRAGGYRNVTGILAGHVADGLGHTNPAADCRCNQEA